MYLNKYVLKKKEIFFFSFFLSVFKKSHAHLPYIFSCTSWKSYKAAVWPQMYFSADKKLCFKAPYVSFVSAVLRHPRLPRLLFLKQTIPLSLPSICCSLTIYLLVPLTTCAPSGPRSSSSSTPSTWNQGIYKNTQSIWAMQHLSIDELWQRSN